MSRHGNILNPQSRCFTDHCGACRSRDTCRNINCIRGNGIHKFQSGHIKTALVFQIHSIEQNITRFHIAPVFIAYALDGKAVRNAGGSFCGLISGIRGIAVCIFRSIICSVSVRIVFHSSLIVENRSRCNAGIHCHVKTDSYGTACRNITCPHNLFVRAAVNRSSRTCIYRVCNIGCMNRNAVCKFNPGRILCSGVRNGDSITDGISRSHCSVSVRISLHGPAFGGLCEIRAGCDRYHSGLFSRICGITISLLTALVGSVTIGIIIYCTLIHNFRNTCCQRIVHLHPECQTDLTIGRQSDIFNPQCGRFCSNSTSRRLAYTCRNIACMGRNIITKHHTANIKSAFILYHNRIKQSISGFHIAAVFICYTFGGCELNIFHRHGYSGRVTDKRIDFVADLIGQSVGPVRGSRSNVNRSVCHIQRHSRMGRGLLCQVYICKQSRRSVQCVICQHIGQTGSSGCAVDRCSRVIHSIYGDHSNSHRGSIADRGIDFVADLISQSIGSVRCAGSHVN